jgi:hypothetical protein
MPDARCTRGPVCKRRKKTHTSIQVQRRRSDIPCAMALRLMPCSPRRSGLFDTVASRSWFCSPGWARNTSARLDANHGGVRTTRFCRTQQPRSSARRLIAHRFLTNPPCHHVSRLALPRPPHPAPTFVTMANAPLCGTGWHELVEMICPTGKVENFLQRGWTAHSLICPSGNSNSK